MAEEDRNKVQPTSSEETLEEILASVPESTHFDEDFCSEPDDDPEDVSDELEDDASEDFGDDFEDDPEEDSEDAAKAPSDEPEGNAETLAKELADAEKGMKNAHRFLIYLVVFLFVVWILFFKIIGITHMPSEGMEPRIDAGDLLVFYRLDRDAEFGDVIIFEKDVDGTGRETMMVGRVVAAPGDTVDINENNRLVVNGNAIVESSLLRVETIRRGERVQYPLTLGEDEYFVLSDNRTAGVDSRYFGPVKKKDILGTVITLIRRNKL